MAKKIMKKQKKTKEKIKKQIQCVLCPKSCMISVSINSDSSIKAEGYGCEQGKDYVEKELFSSERTLTTTVKVTGGERPVVSVRTSKPIPKNKMISACRLLSLKKVQAPVRMRQVIEKNILGTEANVVATANISVINN